MNTWQGAWFLAKDELKRTRWKHLITLIFIGYLALFLVPMFAEGLEEEDAFTLYWAVDFVTLTLLPCLGLMATQTIGIYWKTDSYTKKLAVWRTMPITIKQIVLGRVMLLIANGVTAQILFFILFYFAGRSINKSIELDTFILFALLWIGYSIASGIIYIYIETGYSGKFYFWFCMVVTFVFLGAMILYSLMLKHSLVLISYEAIDSGAWWISFIGIALAILAIYIGRQVMEKKLRSRSYTS